MSSKCVAITGGSGYIGQRLAQSLYNDDQSLKVILLDITSPTIELIDNHLIYRYCDLRSLNSVDQCLMTVNCVYHLASFGMSGRDMLNHSMINQVNIIGTKNIIAICNKYHIDKLIYCSTYNAVYTGDRPLYGVNEEQCSYPSSEMFYDHYSRTKSQAEQMILQANSSQLSTVAIRPAAIYGDGEMRHLPRILKLVEHGLAFFAIGNETIRCDWIYAENLIYALILAEKSLPKYSGEVYFISDDSPVNNFQFLAQLIHGLGYQHCFQFYIPTLPMFYLGYFIEIVHHYFSRYIYNFSPFVTRSEVLKMGVTHYANISKAKRLLGYQVQIPPDKAMQRCIHWYSLHGYRKKNKPLSWGIILLIFLFVFILLFWLISIG